MKSRLIQDVPETQPDSHFNLPTQKRECIPLICKEIWICHPNTFVRTLNVFKGTTFLPRRLVTFMFSKIWVNYFYVVVMYIANSLVTSWSATVVLPPHVSKPSDPYEVLSGLTCLHVYKKISATRLAMSGSHFTAVVLKCVWKSSSVPPVYGLKIPQSV